MLYFIDPDKFDWEKGFLQSPMWCIICEVFQQSHQLFFFITSSCPVTVAPSCSQLQDLGLEEVQPPPADEDASFCSPATTKGKRKDRVPVVESEVRRSERMHHLNKGYRKKTCHDSNCMACTAKPHVCNSEVIKKLNSSYCKVDSKVCTEENLLQKKVKRGGKPPTWKD